MVGEKKELKSLDPVELRLENSTKKSTTEKRKIKIFKSDLIRFAIV